jgi:hypothetical protein
MDHLGPEMSPRGRGAYVFKLSTFHPRTSIIALHLNAKNSKDSENVSAWVGQPLENVFRVRHMVY